MSSAQANVPSARRPLRLWPGVALVLVQCVLWFILPLFSSEAAGLGVMGGILCGLLVILVWWAFLSRVPWRERVGAIVLMVAAVAGTSFILHQSIRGGMMGLMFFIYVIPILGVALVVWAVTGRHLADGPRRAFLVVAILVACCVFTLIRTDGLTGDADSDLHWRWTETSEERLMAHAAAEAVPLGAAPEAEGTGADWPGFRGPDRDSILHGVRIGTDWSASPPVELWRRPVGPGWSSFAVHGDLMYTQEQNGDDEVVACYRVSTGEPVWKHRDPTRFYESNAGAGPRSTPTLSNGRAYTFGATGILNALDARDGTVVWSRNAAADTERQIPMWGFSSSPLVVDDVVVVAASGTLAGYDRETGEKRWIGPNGGGGYSSPHLLTIGGVSQILLLTSTGATSLAPADGQLLWDYKPQPPGPRIVQPALTAEGDLLMHDADFAGTGMRRIAVAHGGAGWKVEERWISTGLKPYFNDFVVHQGHAFGFDGGILSCIDVKDGQRKWKGGRFGHGQLLLLPDQDLLLVLSERGELALVQADTEKFTELARVPGIEGKTWNHPVLAGGVLLARNSQEMAAFRLPVP
ncbi:MAG: PQQ-binding-like beta-propeller repeat protein [Candidatus Polarisedimenticolia bacterium]